jgi:hypothetical protein
MRSAHVLGLMSAMLAGAGCLTKTPPKVEPVTHVDSDPRILLFAVGKADVSGADAAYELGYAVALLEEHPSLRALVIGRSDGASVTGYALELCLKRALAVKQALVAHGVTADRVHIGVPRDASGARVSTLNRRAEIVLYDPAAGDPAVKLAVDVDGAR